VVSSNPRRMRPRTTARLVAERLAAFKVPVEGDLLARDPAAQRQRQRSSRPSCASSSERRRRDQGFLIARGGVLELVSDHGANLHPGCFVSPPWEKPGRSSPCARPRGKRTSQCAFFILLRWPSFWAWARSARWAHVQPGQIGISVGFRPAAPAIYIHPRFRSTATLDARLLALGRSGTRTTTGCPAPGSAHASASCGRPATGAGTTACKCSPPATGVPRSASTVASTRLRYGGYGYGGGEWRGGQLY